MLVGTGATLKIPPAVMDSFKAGHEVAIRTICDYAYAPGVSQAILEGTMERLSKTAPEVVWGDFQACERFDWQDKLSQVRLPTLIVCGALDRLTPVEGSRKLAQAIPQAQLRVLEGAGHMVMIEKAGEFDVELAAFLEHL